MQKLIFLVTVCFATIFINGCKSEKMNDNKQYVFIGTYTDSNQSHGIYVYDFDNETGKLTEISHTENISNPSYLALSKNEKYLYAVNENPDTPDTVSAFSFNKENGTLQLLNQVSANGKAACFVTAESSGKFVIETNYGSGNFSVYKTDNDGKLIDPAVQIIQHEGRSINQNQTQARAHSAFLSPDEKFLFVCDLGNDTLYQYPFNANNDKPVDESNAKKYKVTPGFGPRHVAFSANGKYVYLLNELEAKVNAYAFQNDSLHFLQTVTSTDIADTSNDDKGSAAIRVSKNGKYLYASNRGNANNIAVFKIADDGKLDSIASIKTDRHPRDFSISPNGKFLLVASRDDNTVKVYTIDPPTGLFTDSHQVVSLSKPVSVLFAEK